MKIKNGLAFPLAALLALAARADLALPGYWTSHAVLQRDVALRIGGRGTAGERLTVEFAGQSHAATVAPDGRWCVALAPLAAETRPRTMTVSSASGEKIALEDLLVGDVYFLTGCANRIRTPFRKAKSEAEKAVVAAAKDEKSPLRFLTLQAARTDYPAPSRAYADSFRAGGRTWCALAGAPRIDGNASIWVYGWARKRAREDKVPVGVVFYPGALAVEAMMDPSVLRRTPALAELSAKVDACLPETAIGAKAYADYERAMRDWLDAAAATLAAGEEVAAMRPKLQKLSDTEMCVDFNGVVSPLRELSVRGVVYAISEWPAGRDAERLKTRERLEVVRQSLDGVFGVGKTKVEAVQ